MCRLDDLEVERGVTALVHGQALAIFRAQDDEVYALGNHDPFAKPSMIARGIVGVRGGRAVRGLAVAPARLRPAQRSVPRRRPRLGAGLRRQGGRGASSWSVTARLTPPGRGRASRSAVAARRPPARWRSPATPSPRPVRPSPSVVVALHADRRADRVASAASASARRGPEPWTVADHLHGHVADRRSRPPAPAGPSRRAGRRPRRRPTGARRCRSATRGRRCRPRRAARRTRRARRRRRPSDPRGRPVRRATTGPPGASRHRRRDGARRRRCRCGAAAARAEVRRP